MRTIAAGVGILREFLRMVGPCLWLEILLPGGTLVALLLFLVRRCRASC